MPDSSPAIDAIFMEAIQKDSPTEKAEYLDGVCGDNQELRNRVERLLAAYHKTASFLEAPASSLMAASNETLDLKPEPLDAGLAATFPSDAAVVVGGTGHSVLKNLEQTIDVPRVMLRDEDQATLQPLERPNSPEIPSRDPDARYFLQGEIARGGMGSIIKGRDVDLGRDLAIKVLLDEHKDRPEVIQRFIEEAQIGGQLQHPGIAPVYELGQFADQRPFFSMKLVNGGTLSKLLGAREDPADDRVRFLGIFDQVCQTMGYAHARGVMHRDLKPSNIMVGAFGEVQVMDWGLAKVLPEGGVADEKAAQSRHKELAVLKTRRSSGSDIPGLAGSGSGSAGSETQMGSVMGTPAYMSPEQALGKVDLVDQRSDVFGLGAILCEILSGQPPYMHEDATVVLRMARRGKLEEAFTRLDACSADEDLIALAKRCLAAEPVDRPRDAAVLAEEITEYLESVETKLRQSEVERASEAARVLEQKKRTRMTLAMAASLLLALGLGIAGTGWYAYRETQARLVASKRAEAEQLAREEAEASRRAVDQLLYAADVRLADAALKAGNTMEAEQLLARHVPSIGELDHRDFAWRYINNLVHRYTAVLSAPGLASQTALARFGRSSLCVSVSDGNQLLLWDLDNRRLVGRQPAGQSTVRAIASSDQRELLASVASDGTVILWELHDRTLKDTSEPLSRWLLAKQWQANVSDVDTVSKAVAFSKDGMSLLTGSHTGQLRQWHAENGKLLAETSLPSVIEAITSFQDGWIVATRRILAWIRPVHSDSGLELQIQWLLNQSDAPSIEDHIALALSPDACQLAVGTRQGAILVVNLEAGKEQVTLSESRWLLGHNSNVYDLAFSIDGRYLLSASKDGTLKKWDSVDLQLIENFAGHTSRVHGVEAMHDSEIVSCSRDGTLRVWQLEDVGRQSFEFSGPRLATVPSHVKFDAKIDKGYCAHDASSLIIDLKATEVRPSDDWGGVSSFALCSRQKVAIGGSGGKLRTIFVDRQKQVINQLDLNADGLEDRVAFLKDRCVWQRGLGQSKYASPNLYDLSVIDPWVLGNGCAMRCSGKGIRLYAPFGRSELAFAFEDSRYFALLSAGTNSRDQLSSAVIYDELTKRLVLLKETAFHSLALEEASATKPNSLERPRAAACGNFDGDPNLEIVCSVQETLLIFECNDGEMRLEAKIPRRCSGDVVLYCVNVDDDPAEEVLVADDRQLHCLEWDEGFYRLDTVEELELLPLNLRPHANVAIVDPDGRSTPVGFHSFGNVPSGIQLSQDGSQLAVATSDGMVRVWDSASQNLVHTLPHNAKVRVLEFALSNTMLCTVKEDDILVWDLEHQRQLHLLSGHENTIVQLLAVPESSSLISASQDLTVRLWDMESGQLLQVLSGHASDPISLSLSPDGHLLAVGCANGEIVFWHLATQQPVLTLDSGLSLLWAAFKSVDEFIAVGNSQAGTARLMRWLATRD